jgi:hypothetical protein
VLPRGRKGAGADSLLKRLPSVVIRIDIGEPRLDIWPQTVGRGFIHNYMLLHPLSRLSPRTLCEIPPAERPITVSRFTPLEVVEKALLRQIGQVDVSKLADQAAQDALDRIRGCV